MVHVLTAKTSRREGENPVRARNNSSPRILMCWRLARFEGESKSMVHLLHSTKQQEENTSRGQYKEHVLSRYHRPTQNRKQYILNHNKKSTIILNRQQSTSIRIIGNNIKHTYEDSILHTILIWEIDSSNLSTLT